MAVLLRFSAENFLSFKGEVSLSMVASIDDRHPQHLMTSRPDKPLRVTRAAAIYGANGHGKTNLVNAVKFAKDLIVHGYEDDVIPVRPFKEPDDKETRPSKFVFEFSVEGVTYEYGLKVLGSHVAEEWMFHWPRGREVRVFERTTKLNEVGEFQTEVLLGTPLKSKKKDDNASGAEFMQFLAAGTPPTQCYLNEAYSRNVKWFRHVFNWFRSSLQIIQADSDYAALHLRAHEDAAFIKDLSDRMRTVGVGIDHIETSVRTIEVSDLRDLPKQAVEVIEKRAKEGDVVELSGPDGKKILLKIGDQGRIELIDILAVYKRSDGSLVKFSQEEESAGTRRMINLIPMLLDLSREDKTFIVDELDRKLHPVLSYELLSSFFVGSHCGQIIFTTHNTHLLDLDLFRRDEIWFVEKDNDGVTDLYSLIDMNVRPDVEIRRGYLKGRFGAIPFIGNIFDLGWGRLDERRYNNKKEKAARSKQTSP